MATLFAVMLGITLLAGGLWGLLTGAHDHLVGAFGVNGAHNLLNLVAGALALLAALGGARVAKLVCFGFGLIYAALAVAGYANVAAVVQVLNLNTADNALHAAIAALCLWVGMVAKGD